MKYWCEWHYNKNPDLSGNQTLVYYNPFQHGLNVLPDKDSFNKITEFYPRRTSYEEECEYIQSLINNYGKTLYTYLPKIVDGDSISSFSYHCAELTDCGEDFEKDFSHNLDSNAIDYIMNKLIKAPKKLFNMLADIYYEMDE